MLKAAKDRASREPNATTLAAMAEVKSGAELDELTDENIDNLDTVVHSTTD